MSFFDILNLLWNWSRTIFGSVFVFCALVSLGLLIAELIYYHRKKAVRSDRRAEKRIALITGASSGLGRTFALAIDQTEPNIDEIWLVARRRERLMEVVGELHTPSRVFALDLCERESMDVLERALAGEEYADKQDIQVGVFVNCAGFAKIGNYAKVSRRDSDRMIDLNCRAAVDTTLAALPYMQAGDRVIEICSTSAFQSIQHMNLYAAGKAFLYNYTRALRMELLPRGIMVTAVCPWWIKDTEFISVASDNEQNPDVKSAIRAFPLASTEKNVVKRALRASRAGLAVSTPGVMCFFHRLFAKVIPRKWLLYFWEIFRRVG